MFLIDFIESVVLVSKKRRVETEKLSILIVELTKRTKANDDTILGFRLEKLINYCDKYVKAQSPLINELAYQFKTRIKTQYS